MPIDFAAALLYLFYINLATHGNWFWQFAFPVGIGTAVLVCTQVTLLRYLRRGKLYVVGGVVIALGCLMLMIEYLMDAAFSLPFKGWSLYPLTSLVLVGTLLIYLAMNSTAREKIERKIFF